MTDRLALDTRSERTVHVAVFAVSGIAIATMDAVIAGRLAATVGPLAALLALALGLSATWIVCGRVVAAHLALRRFDRAAARMIDRERSMAAHPTRRHRADGRS